MDEGTTRLEAFRMNHDNCVATMRCVILSFCVAAFYLPSTALFER